MATFTKAERLCSRDDINALLGAGKWVNAGVLKVCWVVSGAAGACEGVAVAETGARAEGVADGGCRIMISVPKKNFKRAVARNLLKRRIREAYRLNKEAFTGLGLDMLICYKSRNIHPFADIQRDLMIAREAMVKEVTK